MKKYLLALLAVITIGLTASAVKPEITLSYGGYNQMDACDNHDGWGNVNTSWGSLNAGINFPVTRNFSFGPSYTFSSTTTKGGAFHSKIAYHAIMMNANYIYYRNSIVKVYGHLGLGSVISHMQPLGENSYNKAYFGLQISPVGAQVGLGNGYTMYGELGFGVQGLVQVGFRYQL